MLQLSNVDKSFGKFKALDQLTMTVPKGSVYGLVGPNGAGKSTSIRVMTGVYRADAGEILYDGQPVFENSKVKEKICTIPDDIFYFSSATLDEMKKFYQGIYARFDEELYKKLAEVFKLPEKSPVRRFSKGMQKQAAFYLSICTHPELMVLDEPVDGLDPVMRRQVWSLLMSDVAKEGTTVLVSSHNLRELEDICDHVGIMDHGKMLTEKSLEDMQGNTVKVQLVGDTPRELEVLHVAVSGRMKTLVVRSSAEEAEKILKQQNLSYFDVLPLSLEEIFIYELGGVNDEVKNILL